MYQIKEYRYEMYVTKVGNKSDMIHCDTELKELFKGRHNQLVEEGIDFELLQKNCYHFANAEPEFIAVPVKPTQPPPTDVLTQIEEWVNINYLNIEDQAGDKHECIEREDLIDFIKTLKK